jgi:cyclophilin family peptidyl-prolyl cis-trans isomerase
MSDAALSEVDRYIAGLGIDRGRDGWKLALPKPPELRFDAARRYFWDLDTSVGALAVRLRPEVAPKHVASTLYLVRLGFYDGTIFHRVIPKFMAQGGDPRGTGTGGPGYQYAGEFDASVRHDKPGLLSMANAGPGTDGSQFFLTFVPTAWLDGKHTIFGEVVSGMETLRALEQRGSSSGKPTERLELRRASVRAE